MFLVVTDDDNSCNIVHKCETFEEAVAWMIQEAEENNYIPEFSTREELEELITNDRQYTDGEAVTFILGF